MTFVTDVYPAIATIYVPQHQEGEEFPYPTRGFSDKGATPFVECRVIVHNSKVFVGTDSLRGPKTVFSDTYTQENVHSDGNIHRVLTDTGHLLVFGPSKGCGCGSRLRTWNPYGSIARSEGRK